MKDKQRQRAFSRRLNQQREHMDMTQADLARAMDINRQRLGGWIRGLHYPRPPEMMKLSKILKCDRRWLAGYGPDNVGEVIASLDDAMTARSSEDHGKVWLHVEHEVDALAAVMFMQLFALITDAEVTDPDERAKGFSQITEWCRHNLPEDVRTQFALDLTRH